MRDHPCKQDCPRRFPGCKISCPDLEAWNIRQDAKRKARKKQQIVSGYITDSAFAVKRRLSGWKPVAWHNGGKRGW